MFISSLTLTAVVVACVSFCVVRISATTTSSTPPTASAGTQETPKSGKHHHHHHGHQQRDNEGDGGGGLKIHNFISTDALYDGEREKRIHYDGITAKETAVTTGTSDNTTRYRVTFNTVGFSLEIRD
ncbi:hypothetical protein L9F63_011134 [Diploptera punctata]|uniref:Uncharacterized protein n=1 Tax=Diploptera punctata TaxID=6984 RepID=A0AAD8AG91_DIPPU|nr:hypothetical protein L9F63_011134 [Diploptera punctata]